MNRVKKTHGVHTRHEDDDAIRDYCVSLFENGNYLVTMDTLWKAGGGRPVETRFGLTKVGMILLHSILTEALDNMDAYPYGDEESACEDYYYQTTEDTLP